MGEGHTTEATELRAKESAAVVETLGTLGGNCGGAVAGRGGREIVGETGRDDEPMEIAWMGMESLSALIDFPKGMVEADPRRCLLGLGQP